jgi:hypothetical protein
MIIDDTERDGSIAMPEHKVSTIDAANRDRNRTKAAKARKDDGVGFPTILFRTAFFGGLSLIGGYSDLSLWPVFAVVFVASFYLIVIRPDPRDAGAESKTQAVEFPADKRRHPRMAVDYPVVLLHQDFRTAASLIDVSTGGACVVPHESIFMRSGEVIDIFSTTFRAPRRARIVGQSPRGLHLAFAA